METSIRLADDLVPAMLSGSKKVTIRKGRREFASTIQIAGHLAIVDSVEYYQLDSVPFEILLSDGFISFADVLSGMKRHYPDISSETEVTVIRFHLDSFHLLDQPSV